MCNAQQADSSNIISIVIYDIESEVSKDVGREGILIDIEY